MPIRAIALAIIAAVALTGPACSSDDNPLEPSPTLNVPFSTTDLVVGTGTEATIGRRVTVQYTGWLYSTTAPDNKGSQFDSNTITVPQLGTGVIQGFSQGIVGMRVGGRRRVVIPPALGYGNQIQNGIPANSTLLFEIALIDVQ
jgi:FKBP-type peptidyl-prolyl cis-trans isomerase FkpA